MINPNLARRVIGLIDLTSLSGSETERDIEKLCESAASQYGHTAAVCVYPRFVGLAKSCLQRFVASDIAVATVVNFPTGDDPIEKIVADTELAIINGADEIDMVLPYRAMLAGDLSHALTALWACKNACAGKARLKVIIETGELESPQHILQACDLCLEVGADFIKTSTGKVAVNATLPAAMAILEVLKTSNASRGIKISGGVKTLEEAADYLDLTERMMGADWIDSRRFRFGASSLLNDVIDCIKQQNEPNG